MPDNQIIFLMKRLLDFTATLLLKVVSDAMVEYKRCKVNGVNLLYI